MRCKKEAKTCLGTHFQGYSIIEPCRLRYDISTHRKKIEAYVNRFWEVSTTDKSRLRVLPDGSWDFVLHITPDGREFEFVGPMTSAVTIPLWPNARHYGVRFRPGTYCEPFGKNLAELIDQTIQLEQLIPNVRINTTEPIIPQLIAIVRRLADNKLFVRDQEVDIALTALNDIPSDGNVTTTLRSTGSSLRTLERKFRRFVGLRPKQLVRINRQLAVARKLMLTESPDFSKIAAGFDYVDQAHMSHDLRLLSGTTPKMLHQEYDDFLQYDWPYARHTV